MIKDQDDYGVFAISENLTTEKLIEILKKLPPKAEIDSVRLKASSNVVGISYDTETNELRICD